MSDANVPVGAQKVKPAVYKLIGRRGADSFGTFSRVPLRFPLPPRQQLVKLGWVDLREFMVMVHPMEPGHFLRFRRLRGSWMKTHRLYLARLGDDGNADFFEWEGNAAWVLDQLKESTSRVFVPAGWALALLEALEKEERQEREACWPKRCTDRGDRSA